MANVNCIGGVDFMYNVNITNARGNLYNLVDMAINYSEPVNIVTKKGNAVLISEADYNALMETLYLSSDPEFKKSLIEGMNTPIEECFDESELEW